MRTDLPEVAIGDLNQDGRPDITTANSNPSTESVLLGHGDGTFASALTFPAGENPASIAIGDLDQDRLPDLATANSHADSVSILFHQ